jgi:hypothetical protein
MVAAYNYPDTEISRERTEAFKESVAWEKSSHLPKGSSLTTSFWAQVISCTRRQYQILWGEKSTFLIKQILSCVMALIAGSCFYDSPDTSEGLFTKGGAVFFSLLYNCIVAMSEVTESFKGRPVLIKHKGFAMYHPAAFCLSQITADFPVLLFQCSIFSVVIYWMSGLKHTAAAFFTFWIILFTTTLVSRSCAILCSQPLDCANSCIYSVSPHYSDLSALLSALSKLPPRSQERQSKALSCMLAT